MVAPHVQAVRGEVPAEGEHRERPVALDAGRRLDRPAPEVPHEQLAERRLGPQVLVGAHGRAVVDDEGAVERVAEGEQRDADGEEQAGHPARRPIFAHAAPCLAVGNALSWHT
eukprot:scaffold47723_cov80-Phaeocystis_antarctica.AAC.2